MSLDIILKHDVTPHPAPPPQGGREEKCGFTQEKTNESVKGAVLLFHGLTGSPFELQKYARFLYQNGYDVYANCLRGHGDKFEEIYTVTYQDWLNQAYKDFADLKLKYENVYVAGLCLGAVLAIAVAIKYPDEVKGVVSLSTTLFLDGWRLPWFNFLIPIALATIFRFYYNYPECEPHGIKNIKTRNVVKRLLAKGDVGMNNFPMTAIYELLKLSKSVRSNLSKFTSPILIIHSKEDDLTSVKSAKTVYKNISSIDKEMIILYNSYHMVLYDNEKEFVFNKTLEFMDKYLAKSLKNEEFVCI